MSEHDKNLISYHMKGICSWHGAFKLAACPEWLVILIVNIVMKLYYYMWLLICLVV